MSRGKPCHLEVVIRDQRFLEKMIKKFSRKCKKLGIFDEVRERRYFKKKSQVRKEKRESRKRKYQQMTQKYKDKFKNEYK
jgi:ribosomal protein S21|tara:strand:+ start:270 stop:509 length:240 start_codon:yes stop_codon:yes gene_type:complete